MDLFENSAQANPQLAPLPERLRPSDLQGFTASKDFLLKYDSIIKNFQKDRWCSLILWGPPGSGKTTFAKALCQDIDSMAVEIHAIDLGSKKIRELGEQGKNKLLQQQKKTLIFVDEIHRLNRGQQDNILPYIEKGYFYLIGATTENPSYQLNSALLSRCQLLVFEPHSEKSLRTILKKAFLTEDTTPEDALEVEAIQYLIEYSQGDARRMLNAVEQILFLWLEKKSCLSLEALKKKINIVGLRYDKKGDEHYDTISAFIKSIRGSHPDAGLYYLARMLEGGEDPLFIARRLIILASEDIGNGDPNALTLAVSCLKSIEAIGMPEGRIPLAQCVVYLACAPKSNASYKGINKAIEEVKKSGPLSLPKSLRSSKTSAMKSLGYGHGYKYSHDGDRGYADQNFLPQGLKTDNFYQPTGRGFEKKMEAYLNWVHGKKNPSETTD